MGRLLSDQSLAGVPGVAPHKTVSSAGCAVARRLSVPRTPSVAMSSAVSPESLFCAGRPLRAASVLAQLRCGAWCFSGGRDGYVRRAVTAISGTSRDATTMPRPPFSMALSLPSGHNYCGPGHRTMPRTQRNCDEPPRIATREAWLAARKELLAKEKP